MCTAQPVRQRLNINLINRVCEYGQRQPFGFQLFFAIFKCSAADLIVQCTLEKKALTEVSWRRVGVFAAFGAAYQGGFQYWLFVRNFSRMFPSMPSFTKLPLREKLADTQGLLDTFKQVVIRNFVAVPVVYWPTFYILKEFMHLSPTTSSTHVGSNVVSTALQKYAENGVSDNLRLWQFWLVADPVIFLLPLWLRLPSIHALSFAWIGIMSATFTARSSSTLDTPKVKVGMELEEGAKKESGESQVEITHACKL